MPKKRRKRSSESNRKMVETRRANFKFLNFDIEKEWLEANPQFKSNYPKEFLRRLGFRK